jgi:hypothetical protein
MVGGVVKDIILKSTFKLDENLVYDEMAMMKQGRFGAPITLLKDKYIVAAGGQVNTNKCKYTNLVEVMDIQNNKWQNISPLH